MSVEEVENSTLLNSDLKTVTVVPNNINREPNGTCDDSDVAIRLESAYKHYGSRKSGTPVLMGLDMEVKKGQIYGLLGEEINKQ